MLVAVAWSLFQLWYASPLPFMLGFGILGDERLVVDRLQLDESRGRHRWRRQEPGGKVRHSNSAAAKAAAAPPDPRVGGPGS